MTCDKEMLHDMTEYNGGCVVAIANNSQLPITDVGSTVLAPQFNPQKVAL